MDFDILFRIKNTTANSQLGSLPLSPKINIVSNFIIYKYVDHNYNTFLFFFFFYHKKCL